MTHDEMIEAAARAMNWADNPNGIPEDIERGWKEYLPLAKAALEPFLAQHTLDTLAEAEYISEMLEKHADRADMFQPDTEVIETRWVKLFEPKSTLAEQSRLNLSRLSEQEKSALFIELMSEKVGSPDYQLQADVSSTLAEGAEVDEENAMQTIQKAYHEGNVYGIDDHPVSVERRSWEKVREALRPYLRTPSPAASEDAKGGEEVRRKGQIMLDALRTIASLRKDYGEEVKDRSECSDIASKAINALTAKEPTHAK